MFTDHDFGVCGALKIHCLQINPWLLQAERHIVIKLKW
jgi:hypothetical protein